MNPARLTAATSGRSRRPRSLAAPNRFGPSKRTNHASTAVKVGHRCRRSEPLMDLVTLVTACALSIEPKLMHALIWHQSGGEPWAVAVQNERMPRVYSSMQEAISEAHSISIPNDPVRVGLAGLPVSPIRANAAMFLPCRNVADLASCARAVWVIMDHVTRTGAPRLLEKCTLPLTAVRCVKRIYTDLAVVDITQAGM